MEKIVKKTTLVNGKKQSVSYLVLNKALEDLQESVNSSRLELKIEDSGFKLTEEFIGLSEIETTEHIYEFLSDEQAQEIRKDFE